MMSWSRVRLAPSTFIVKLVQVVDDLRCLLHLALVLLTLLSDHCILAIDKLAQLGGHILPHRDGASESVNGGHHGIRSILETMSPRRRSRVAGWLVCETCRIREEGERCGQR